jgi:hypothetical protein
MQYHFSTFKSEKYLSLTDLKLENNRRIIDKPIDAFCIPLKNMKVKKHDDGVTEIEFFIKEINVNGISFGKLIQLKYCQKKLTNIIIYLDKIASN